LSTLSVNTAVSNSTSTSASVSAVAAAHEAEAAASLVAHAASAVGNIAAHAASANVLATAPGVLPAVLKLLQSDRPDTREMAAGAARNLALTEIGRGALVRSPGFLKALLACLMHGGGAGRPASARGGLAAAAGGRLSPMRTSWGAGAGGSTSPSPGASPAWGAGAGKLAEQSSNDDVVVAAAVVSAADLREKHAAAGCLVNLSSDGACLGALAQTPSVAGLPLPGGARLATWTMYFLKSLYVFCDQTHQNIYKR
jgi:hypothetical protein